MPYLPFPATVFPSLTPVETKGYKNIMKLPDLLRNHDTVVYFKKRHQNGKITPPESRPVLSVHKNRPSAIGPKQRCPCHPVLLQPGRIIFPLGVREILPGMYAVQNIKTAIICRRR